MKWPSDQIDILDSGFAQVLANGGYDVETLRQQYADEAPMALVNAVFRKAWYDLQYDDTHPAYTAGTWDDGTPRKARRRLVQHNPAFVLTPPGCNDSHRKTVLIYLGRKHGLID